MPFSIHPLPSSLIRNPPSYLQPHECPLPPPYSLLPPRSCLLPPPSSSPTPPTPLHPLPTPLLISPSLHHSLGGWGRVQKLHSTHDRSQVLTHAHPANHCNTSYRNPWRWNANLEEAKEKGRVSRVLCQYGSERERHTERVMAGSGIVPVNSDGFWRRIRIPAHAQRVRIREFTPERMGEGRLAFSSPSRFNQPAHFVC